MSVPFSHFFFGRNVYKEREREIIIVGVMAGVRNSSFRATLRQGREGERERRREGGGRRERGSGGGVGEGGQSERRGWEERHKD